MMSRRLFGILLLFVVIRLSAQFAPTRLYTADDGMFVTEVTSVCADGQGRLLVGAYGKGSMRFDGKNFTRIAQTNTVNAVVWDGKQEWIWNHFGEHIYLFNEKGEVRSFTIGKTPLQKFSRQLNQKKLPAGDIGINPVNGKPIFTCRNYIYYYDAKQNAFVFSDSMPLPTYHNGANFQLVPDYWGKHHLLAVQDSNFINRFIYQRINGHLQPLPMPKNYTIDAEWHVVNIPGGTVYAHAQKGIFVRNEGGWQSFLAPVVQKMKEGFQLNGVQTILSNGHFLIELTNNNIHYLFDFTPDLKQYKITVFKFSGRCLNFFQDKAGTYWTPTHSGLLRIFPAFAHFFSEDDPAMLSEIHTVVADARQRIWVGSYSNGLGYIYQDSIYTVSPVLAIYKNFLPGSICDDAGNLLFSVEDAFVHGLIQVNPEQQTAKTIFYRQTGYILQRNHEGRLLYGSENHGLFIQKDKNCGYADSCWIKIGEKQGLSLGNVLGVVQDQYGHYWMGRASRGIAVYLPEQKKAITFLISENQTQYGGISFTKDRWGKIWIGTVKGLVHFDPPAVINDDFKLDEYLKPIAPTIFEKETTSSVYNYHDSLLIVLNKKGMGVLNLQAFYAKPQRPYAYMLAPDDGYTGKAGDQNCITEDVSGNVWFGNDKGLTRFYPKKYLFDTAIPSKPILLSFTSYGDTLSVIDGVIKGLRNKHTNVVIHFDWENSPFLYNNISFEYQLDKDSLIAVEKNQVEFTRLAPGNYSFKLYAVKGNVRSEPLLLSFRIPPLWYQNPLILGGIILFLIFIIIIIIAWYQNKLKQERILGELKEQQERQRRELLTVRVQAIVNQLNPHFIINALTWLQVRAQRSNDLSSVSIIERLAENLKIIFINSREKRAFHTLWDEMQLVENYFRIQKVRFGDKVTYHLPDSELIKKWGQCVRVPLMLLLIHVENAIEHGLKKKRGGGCVNITIEDKSKDYLIFTIEDTGIGRKKAGEIPSISTRQGTKMLAELIAIFNSKNDQKITQYYEDEIFINSNGCPYGTRIIIQLPKIYTYALSD